jgi:gluconokinase
VTVVLALDVGTSSVRAQAYDEQGQHVRDAEARERYEVRHGPGGRAEFDADVLALDAAEALEEARREVRAPVAAVGASCFWHSLVAVDGRGRALTPVLTWRDTRSVDDADELRRRLDPDAVHARTGCHLHPSYWPAKLAWLRRADPETFRAAHRFLSFSDYLYGRLVGSTATSLSMASATGLLNQNEARWDDELLGELDLDPDRLPQLDDGPVEAEDGIPWYPALGDGACSNVGAGCTTPRRAALMVGTSAAVRVCFAAERAEPRPGLFLYRLDRDRFVAGGALSDGGNLYAWLERTLRLPADAQLPARPPDAHGLTFLPLLGGERSPGWNGRARGAIAGLTFETTPEDIAQAGLEGVAFRLAELADLLAPLDEVVASGGALNANPRWVQILADVLERPVLLSQVAEASARGAAVVTLERLGEAPPDPEPGVAFLPREDASEAYRSARERQRNLYRGVT